MMKRGMKHYLFILGCLSSVSGIGWAATPIFSVTPRVSAPSQLLKYQTGTVTYQVTNNTNYALNGLGLIHLPAGVSLMPKAGDDYCDGTRFNLAAHGSCLLKLKIVNNGSNSGSTLSGGPTVCYSADNPVYCSQPLTQDQLNIPLSTTPITDNCDANVANFDNELQSSFQSASATDNWGPPISHAFSYSTSHPNISNCPVTAGIPWKRQRILAAADFWVRQKLNYCHHYLPDWMTPVGPARQTTNSDASGYCSGAVDLAPGTPYYGQPVRWNYSGAGSETAANWSNNNYMWYGMDCSNYTRFLYAFALGAHFSGDVAWQAGQRDGFPSPNHGNLSKLDVAGKLVCADGTTEDDDHCVHHNGPNPDPLDKYFSVIDHNGNQALHITDAMLETLQPGDLIYISAHLQDGSFTPKVTHVVMWTGKKVGNGAEDIPASRIAPNSICPNDWRPHTGDWVITDSHYQGADYRVFTNCFYRNHVWGVRRVID